MKCRRLLAAAACLVLSLPALASTSPTDADIERAEERELVVLFDPAVFKLEAGGRPSALRVLEAVHPEVVYSGLDATGTHRFRVAPEHADRIPEFKATLRRMGATVGKELPSARIQEIYRVRMLARRQGEPDVRGLIVKYRDLAKRADVAEGMPLDKAQMERLSRITGKAVVRSRAMSGAAHVAYFDAPTDLLTGDLLARRLAMAPDVERVDLNTVHDVMLTPNDEFFSNQWSLTSSVSGIRAPQAWDITTGSSNIVAAVIDTGYLPYADFGSRVLPGADTITLAARSNDGDGRDASAIDAGNGYDAGFCGTGTPAKDSNWHGTHVMGILGATGNNGVGTAGVDWRARLLPVRALGRCGGDTADIIDGMRWAAGMTVPGLATNPNPARVINMSLGGPGACTSAYNIALMEAMQRRSTVIAAAGNSNQNALEGVPAGCALVLTVAAVGPTGDKASYSNYTTAMEIAAPGGEQSTGWNNGILSMKPTGTRGDPGALNSYDWAQGTSQAAPHVAGVASLMLAVAPNLTVAQVRDILQGTARTFPAGSRCATQGDCGSGILDAAAAVTYARDLANVRWNYAGLWWRSNESGWGVNFQQQGNIIFGTWFTYATGGKGIWYVMPALTRVTDDVFAGDIYVTTGVPLNQIAGQQSLRSLTKVGTASLFYFNFDRAMFLFELDGVVGVKQIKVQEFAQPPVCTFTSSSRAGLTNYQDLWWNPQENGWGINLAHQGDIIFATWFTYGPDGSPLWLVAPDARKTGASTFSGTVYQTTGRRPQDVSNEAVTLSVTEVGTMTLNFSSGESGQFSYTVFGQSGSKTIQRQVWSTPLSTCRNP